MDNSVLKSVLLICAAAASSCDNTPATPCACDANIAPVCGVDGKTYTNACQAGCAGVAVASTGACKKDGSSAETSGQ